MPAEERLEYVIQATVLIWEPLVQMRHVVTGDVDFDSFGMAPCLSGWRPGMPVGCMAMIASVVRRSGL